METREDTSSEYQNLRNRSYKKAEIPYGVNDVAKVTYNKSTGTVVLQKRNIDVNQNQPVLQPG